MVANEVPHRVDNEGLSTLRILPLDACTLLHDMRMATDDGIYALVSEPLRELSLGSVRGLLVLVTPVDLYDLVLCSEAICTA